MKRKFVGIVIFILVVTTVVSATNINMKENIQTTASSADVPVWEVGDTWTYDVHIYIAASPNVIDDMVLDARGELVLEVSKVTNEAIRRGAALVVLQASKFGEPIYRRMGFKEFTQYPWYMYFNKA